MRSGSTIFTNSEGKAATYMLSRVVERLDAFISHNWSVSRRQKHSCLVLHYNLVPALFVGLVASVFIMLLTVLGFLPMFEVVDEQGYDRIGLGYCTWVGHAMSISPFGMSEKSTSLPFCLFTTSSNISKGILASPGLSGPLWSPPESFSGVKYARRGYMLEIIRTIPKHQTTFLHLFPHFLGIFL